MNIDELVAKIEAAGGRIQPKANGGYLCQCPAHEDSTASLSIDSGGNGLLLKCFAGCPTDKICAGLGIKVSDLFYKNGKVNAIEVKAKIVATYDYTDETGELVYQVCRLDPKSFRQRKPDGNGGWIWGIKGIELYPYNLPKVIDAIRNLDRVIICEGEKDCIRVTKETGVISTTNSGGAANKWPESWGEYFNGGDIYIITDKDEPGRNHAKDICEKLISANCRVFGPIELPDIGGKKVKDASDWFNAGGTREQFIKILDSTNEYGKRSDKLSIRTFSEILSLKFDDSDRILGDRLLAKGQPMTILGAGGVGKSRLVIQMLCCIILERKFIGFETRGKGTKWLVLQTENSNRRLKWDLDHFRKWISNDKDWELINQCLFIHTLERDEDYFVSLENPDNRIRISEAIQEINPSGVIYDPLGDFGIGDLNKDEDMRETVRVLSKITRQGNVERCPIILHHARTGLAGVNSAIGYERTGFARNSKVLHSWTRGQINIAPGNSEDNETLVITCGKCSNGKEFDAFAVKLNGEMIYEEYPDFDMEKWQCEVTGKKEKSMMNNERVKELLSVPMDKKQLANVIREDCGCTRESAYRYIRRAELARLIACKNDLYNCL